MRSELSSLGLSRDRWIRVGIVGSRYIKLIRTFWRQITPESPGAIVVLSGHGQHTVAGQKAVRRWGDGGGGTCFLQCLSAPGALHAQRTN